MFSIWQKVLELYFNVLQFQMDQNVKTPRNCSLVESPIYKNICQVLYFILFFKYVQTR